MNVAMSRARELLIIIGDQKTLQRDSDWSKVLQKADIRTLRDPESLGTMAPVNQAQN